MDGNMLRCWSLTLCRSLCVCEQSGRYQWDVWGTSRSNHRHSLSHCDRAGRFLSSLPDLLFWLDHQTLEQQGNRSFMHTHCTVIHESLSWLRFSLCCRITSRCTRLRITRIMFMMSCGLRYIPPSLRVWTDSGASTCGTSTMTPRLNSIHAIKHHWCINTHICWAI